MGNTTNKKFEYDPFQYDDYKESDAVTAAGTAIEEHKKNKPGEFTYKDYAESEAVTNAGTAIEEHKQNKPGEFSYEDYVESDSVRQAGAVLDQLTASKPGAYSSKWDEQINDILAEIQGRKDFSYDVNQDALYELYKDQYARAGQMAMQDTMGQAVAMTGGFGNSYAASVGNQAYQGYMQQLTDKIPELSQMAYERYRQEGQDLKDLYALYRDREDSDYSRYRDTVADFESELDYLTGRYDTERNLDYGKYADERAFAYGQHRDDVADYQSELDYLTGRYDTERSLDYGKYADERAFDYGKYVDDRNLDYAEHVAETQRQYEEAKASGNESAALEHVSSMSSAQIVDNLKYYSYEEDYTGLAAFLDDCVATGRMTEEQADQYYAEYYKETGETINTTVPKAPAPKAGGSAGKFAPHYVN